MMISQDQAAAFAQWLAGSDANLPTRAQWDLAAGLSDENPRTGPIAREPTEVADGRELKSGPLPVGSASGDRSSSGLHDLAGNGMEWTRDQEFSYPVIRGRSFDESLDKSPPLTFEELQNAAVMEPKPDPRIGFRVVIEIRP